MSAMLWSNAGLEKICKSFMWFCASLWLAPFCGRIEGRREVEIMSDGNKIRHNLALAYANNKLQIALQRGERPQGLDLNDPAQAACVLASWYSDCLEQLINLEDSKIYSPSSMD